MSEPTYKITPLYGYIELLPYRWITDKNGRMGQQYLRIDRDRDGGEVSRKVLEPQAWVTWE